MSVEAASKAEEASCGVRAPRHIPAWASRLVIVLWFVAAASVPCASAPLKQFDIFPGYDGVMVSGAWAPMTFELLNEGPAFKGKLSMDCSPIRGSSLMEVPLELPTGTRKRFCIPVFVNRDALDSWSFVLRDESGQVRDERRSVKARVHVGDETVVLAGLPKSVAGMPVLAEVARPYQRYQPQTARFTSELFPDHPLALEGLNAIYLNAEKAAELRENQVRALISWLQQGGHLIIGLHAPSDADAAPWLRRLLPVETTGMEKTAFLASLAGWCRSSHARLYSPSGHGSDVQEGFEQVPASAPTYDLAGGMVTAKVREGRVLAAHQGRPLVVSTGRGRGLATVLLFTPEMEPFRSWSYRGYFYAKLLEVPPLYYSVGSTHTYWKYYQACADNLMGVLTDSRQIHKLPMGWLVVLLMGYLAVIGPVDYFLLRRLKRPMLTWLTFPAYVVVFSGLIYLVGYKLRAGDTEWNEFHVADLHPREQGGAQIRGWNFVGVYAPKNLSFPIVSSAPVASFREEWQVFGSGRFWSQKRFSLQTRGDGFQGNLFIPVWTTHLFVEEYWAATRDMPLTARWVKDQNLHKVEVQNHLARPLAAVMILAEKRANLYPTVGPRQKAILSMPSKNYLADYAGIQNSTLITALHERRESSLQQGAWLNKPEDWLQWTAAISILHGLNERRTQEPPASLAVPSPTAAVPAPSLPQFQANPFFDLSASLKRGHVAVLAAVENHLPKPALLQQGTEPSRGFRYTVYRLVIPPPPDANP